MGSKVNNGKATITVLIVKLMYLVPHLPVSDRGVSGVRCLYLGVPTQPPYKLQLLITINFLLENIEIVFLIQHFSAGFTK